jgi:hypothetical protein
MGKHKRLRGAALACGIALSLAQQISGAGAFSTEPVPAPPASLQANPPPQFIAPGISGQTPQFDLNDPSVASGKSKGTDVTIPGFGTIATLPKLDFGLELLYGPKGGPETYQYQLEQRDQRAPDDMQIKGTLSHKF